MDKNRNSLRSIRMIKVSYLEILKEKDINKISVKEIAEKADLTRNTFYAHFRDVYDVNEAVENDVINQTINFIDTSFSYNIFAESLTFFKKVMQYVENDKTNLNALFKHGDAGNFINKYSNRILEHVFNHMTHFPIKDKQSFAIFLSVLFTGSVYVIRQYFDNEINLSIDEIASILNDIFVNCYKMYL